MSSKKKGLLSLLAIAAVMLVLMLASGGIYNGLASIGRHNVVPAGNSFTAGTYEGTGQGKMGDIRVKVTLSDTAIESIEVLDQTETPDIADPAFASLPAAMVDHQTVYDVDDVAGATVTSHAIKEAVAGALAQAGVDARTLVPVEGGAAAASSETEAAAAETEAEKPAAETEAETEAAAAADSESLYADGVYEGTGNGNGGEVKVNVTVENGKISDIVLQEGHSETPGIYEMAVDQVIPAIIEAQSTDVDSASGASMTSAGIREAVEDALSKAAAGSAEQNQAAGDTQDKAGLSQIEAVGGVLRKIDPARISQTEEIAGHGVRSVVDGKEILAGNAKLMRKYGIAFSEEEYGGTVVYVACDGHFAGTIVISDTIKEGVPEAIRSLKEAGVRQTVMLTGDNEAAAKQTAREAGVDQVYSQLLPADKVEQVEKLIQAQTGRDALAFVGDGINDAPVLMRSDVGIAMGVIGSDAAIEAADIVLMDDDVRKIARTVHIARKTMGIIHANIIFAILVKVLILILSVLGIANMWMAIFGDVGVLILCILNAMRLLRKDV